MADRDGVPCIQRNTISHRPDHEAYHVVTVQTQHQRCVQPNYVMPSCLSPWTQHVSGPALPRTSDLRLATQGTGSSISCLAWPCIETQVVRYFVLSIASTGMASTVVELESPSPVSNYLRLPRFIRLPRASQKPQTTWRSFLFSCATTASAAVVRLLHCSPAQ